MENKLLLFSIAFLVFPLPRRLLESGSGPYSLRVEMTDADGNFRRADYDTFSLAGAEYVLAVAGFDGDSGGNPDRSDENQVRIVSAPLLREKPFKRSSKVFRGGLFSF